MDPQSELSDLKINPCVVAVAVLAVLLFLLYWQGGAELEKSNYLVSELKTKLNEANSRLDDANAKLDKARAIIEEADKRIAIANQREVEVKVSFRKGFIDSGYVAVFRNIYDRSVVITADIERPSSRKKRSIEMTFDPSQSKEIGESEGWAFVPGDTVTINQDNHRSLIFTMQ